MTHWRTKSGELLAVKDMKTSHIENCIAMLERIPDLNAEANAATEQGYNFEASKLLERAEKIKDAIDSFEFELKLRAKGKPIGEDYPLPVIQSWEVSYDINDPNNMQYWG